ncbi:MAG: hypothetical protein U0168_22840 [Nannocystaceae bacterium]
MATCGRRPSRRREHGLLVAALLGACDDDAGGVIDRAAVPAVEACDGVRKWPRAASSRPRRCWARSTMRARSPALRRARAFPAAPALAPRPRSTCAARVQAQFLADGAPLGHAGVDDDDPDDRVAAAGYDASLSSELVALGDVSPADIVARLWQPSAAHCAALHGPQWRHAGAAVVQVADTEADADSEPRDVFVLVLAAP